MRACSAELIWLWKEIPDSRKVGGLKISSNMVTDGPYGLLRKRKEEISQERKGSSLIKRAI